MFFMNDIVTAPGSQPLLCLKEVLRNQSNWDFVYKVFHFKFKHKLYLPGMHCTKSDAHISSLPEYFETFHITAPYLI